MGKRKKTIGFVFPSDSLIFNPFFGNLLILKIYGDARDVVKKSE